MGNVGGGEILVILLAALLILGPNKLPEAARQLGRAMGEIRKVTGGFQRELQDAMKDMTGEEDEARKRGEAIAATRPVTTVTTDSTAPIEPATTETMPADTTFVPPDPSGTTPGSEPVAMNGDGAQIPPAPVSAAAGDDVTVAPGSDN